MTGPTRSTPGYKQPPRPPNAWILYRTDKGRELPPPPQGCSRPQAEVSKIISAMWRVESDEVRSEYERRADWAKSQHQIQYPLYRYKPMKRQEKERLREEARMKKERGRVEARRIVRTDAAPYPTSHVAPLTAQQLQHYQQEAIYGNAGPSPPLSAASSPYSGSQYGLDDHSTPSSDHASPSPDSIHAASTNATPSSVGPIELPSMQFMPPVALEPIAPSQLPLSGSRQWHQQPAPLSNHPAALAPIWQGYQSNPPQPTIDSSISEEYFNFNLPALPNSSWGQGVAPQSTDTVQAMVSTTRDPTIFQLSNLNMQNFLSNPQGEIEVSFGQIPFDITSDPILPDRSPDIPDENYINLPDTLTPSETIAEIARFLDLVITNTDQRRDISITSADNMFDYINLDEPLTVDIHPTPGIFSYSTTDLEQGNLEQASLEQTNVEPTNTVSSTPYVPPNGAVHSSTRRVGASWKPTFAPESNDQSPPRRASSG